MALNSFETHRREQAQQLFFQGRAAIKDGHKADGRSSLVQALKYDPEHSDAWMWLAATTEDVKEQCECLERAVAACPQGGNLAVDHVRMAGKAKVVVAAHLDVTGSRHAALQRVTALPQLDLAPDMVVVDALAEELWVAGCPEFTLVVNASTISNSKPHR
jgi:hypothetical protein